jgi:hypothetical protein
VSWTGLDLDGNEVTAADRPTCLALIAARDAAIRRRRLGRGQDPEPGRHPITWELRDDGRPIGWRTGPRPGSGAE